MDCRREHKSQRDVKKKYKQRVWHRINVVAEFDIAPNHRESVAANADWVCSEPTNQLRQDPR